MSNLAAFGLDADELAAFENLTEAEQREYIALLEQVLEDQWTLTPKQELAEALWHKVDWFLYGGSAGGGKMTALRTRIPTPSGWTTMGELQVGDELFTEKGAICQVTHLHPIDLKPESYRLTFSDGQTVDACADHKWWTYTANDLLNLTKDDDWRSRRRAARPSRVSGNKSERFTAALVARNAARAASTVMPRWGGIRTTKEIAETLLAGGRRNHHVPLADAVDLPDVDLLIDPYVLGAWLGDGSSAGGGLTGIDPEIWHHVEAAGYEVTHSASSTKAHYIKGLVGQLREVGVLNDKHVPDVYLWSSPKQRLALLQGLMDTDGHACESGAVEFVNTNKALAEAVVELACSLGHKARMTESRATLYGKDCGPRYRVKWSAPDPVFRLERKLAVQRTEFRRTAAYRTIVSCDPIEPVPMRCITVSNPTGIFLVENFIPTHNSEFACWHANNLSELVPGHVSLLVRQSIPELRRSLILRMIARTKQFKLDCKFRKVDGQTGFHYKNDSLIECGYLATDEHVGNYLSAEYDCVHKDTEIIMADGSARPINQVRRGDMVMTLDGPRMVDWCGPVGLRDAVEIETHAGTVVTSSSHRLWTPRGWVAPEEMMGTSAWSADGRSGSVASGGSRQVAQQPQEWSFLATLLGPDPRSTQRSSGLAGDPRYVRASDPSGWSALDCRASCTLDPCSCGGQSHRLSEAARARTPSQAGAGRSGGDLLLRDDPVRTPSRTRLLEHTWLHPYTMEARPLAVAVHQASVRMVRVGVQEMWDMMVQGANSYCSSSLTIHQNCIIIDEATQLTSDQIVQLAGRLRTTKEKAARGARPHLGMFTNPGGASHAWMYDMLVTATDYGNKLVVYNVANGLEKAFPVREYVAPISIREATPDDIHRVLLPWAQELQVEVDPETELAVAFVPSRATDNPHIDRSYLKFLNTLPERRRRQLRDGDWDVFEGQYFHEWRRETHVIEPFDIPEDWPKARGADFGTRAPWCMLWGAWDNDGNCYVYREAYAAGLTPEMQAAQAIELSNVADLRGIRHPERYERTVADPSVFSDKRGNGRSVAQMWADSGLRVTRAKNDRIAGWANLRQYLWDYTASKPRLYVFSNCTNLIRTMPLQMHDKKKQEDLDTTAEDHALDALRYLLATRPLGERERQKKVGQSLDDRFHGMMRSLDKRKRPKWM